MTDIISREEVVNILQRMLLTENMSYGKKIYRNVTQQIKSLPTVEAEPRKRGQWVNIREMGEGRWYGECNRCWHLRHIDEYCSNCGAKMDDGEE